MLKTKTLETAEIKAADDSKRTAVVIASDETIDSYGEVIDAKSWQLERFRSAGAPVLFAHDSRSLPIGVAESVEVRDGRLIAKIRFASAEANPVADQAWRLAKEGILRGVSVGFVPGRERVEKRNGLDVTVLYDSELREISLTPVQANPGAKVLEVKAASREAELEAELRAARAEIMSREVDSHVGVRITPAEREAFLELRQLSKPLFEKMIALKPVLNLSRQIIPTDDRPTPPVDDDSIAQRDWALVERAAREREADEATIGRLAQLEERALRGEL